MSTPRSYSYCAFISYNHKDAAFAKRLQQYLMKVRLPAAARSQYPELTKKLNPIFRDETDLGIENLRQGILRGLQQSRYLIVICSEHAARPNNQGKNWVDMEVRAFLEQDEENRYRVIPILLRGKNGPSSAECLPPAVQELGIRAADVAAQGERGVFRAVAVSLWQIRDIPSPPMPFGRTLCRSLAAAVLAAGGGGAWYAWDYYVPHYSYFADYAERNDIPQGIRPLSKEETEHMYSHYRFTTHHHRLTRVETLNGAGYPRDASTLPGCKERPVSLELTYSDRTGNVVTQTCYDERGKVVQKSLVGTPGFHFRSLSKEDGRNIAGGTGNSVHTLFSLAAGQGAGHQNIGCVAVERDEQGFITRERFLCNAYGTPVSDETGVWGRLYRRDALGRPLQITNIDQEGLPLGISSGVASIRYDYHPKTGRVQSLSYHDAQGNIICCEQGYACVRYDYDAQGNWITEAYFDTEGLPCTGLGGYACRKAVYDARGNLVAESYFDAEGHLCMGKGGYACRKADYDERGELIQERYFDTKNRLCMSKGGYACRKAAYDARGNLVAESYFDTEGHLCMGKGGYACRKADYDERGELIQERYFDTENRLCMSKGGYAYRKADYDEQGELIQESYFDTEGRPCLCSDGYASLRTTRDAQGNLTMMAYFDTEGCPCPCRDGYASMRATYDAQGNQTTEAYFDTEGNPQACKEGFARWRATYDLQRNQTSVVFIGKDGQPYMYQDDYAGMSATYDIDGNISLITYFDAEGKPIRTARL